MKRLKIINLIALLIIVFVAAVVIWYSPAMFKGYPAMELWGSSILARNYYQKGVFGTENKLNVFLSSSLAKEQAEISTDGNKMTPIVLAQIFKLTGLPKYENLIFVSIIILAFVLLIFTGAVYCLFGLKTAALFAFVYVLLPFNWWYGSYNFGVYEVCLLFFSLFFLFFILGLKSEWKYKNIFVIFSGMFLALAGMAKESIWLIVPVLFLYLILKRQKKILLYLFIPFMLIISVLWLPDMLIGKNSYLYLFTSQPSQQSEKSLSWDQISHFFPDPYTYHFNRQKYLDNFEAGIGGLETELITRLKMEKAAANIGVRSPNLRERLKIGTTNLIRHLSRFAAIEDIGGPFVFLLLLLGLVSLRRKDKYFYSFFVLWPIFVFLFLSYISLCARTHLIDFGWLIALVVALGLLSLIDILSDHFRAGGNEKIFISVLLIILFLYSLVLSSHVLWGKIYDKTHFLKMSVYGEEINKLNISERDVIAVNLEQFQINKLNYLTDKSMVVFVPETVEELIKENKLQDAFDKFGVKYILGYSPELTQRMLINAKVKNIVSDDVDLTLPEVSKTKSWLMNLIR